ncbi:hypothetical protein EON65_13015 [archaeon]|nr:MAG: hypothetical protein EON65_13015 [archaeon]
MLHELLESKESSIMPSQQPLVINYAITEGPVPSKSNNLNNNDASPARVLRDQKASCDASILAEVKKTEKDLKDSIQSLFVLPKTILSTLKGFNTALSSSGVPAPSSPGKKTSPVKLQEPISSLANSKNASRVYSCGQNCYGELGLGDANPRKSFTQISSLDDKCIVSIGAGNEHSLFVTKSGKLLTAGYNDNGQCGVGNTQQVRQPTVVYALEDEEVQHVYVYNGCEHTIAVTKEGKVYSFGYNYRGQVDFIVHYCI